ncbi:hypothetical protein GCM10010393_47460 [Streptomyces gobitricini]|uniref:Uncharacterized protein n=1 Tax=Streptomyces gobitricini TaxID=68211 RepID=A0ABP6A8P2_9ACTN
MGASPEGCGAEECREEPDARAREGCRIAVAAVSGRPDCRRGGRPRRVTSEARTPGSAEQGSTRVDGSTGAAWRGRLSRSNTFR